MIYPRNITNEGGDFDGVVYSKFKFGCIRSTSIMAKELADYFIEYDRMYNVIDHDPTVQLAVVGPAFKRIPPAGWLLAEYFTNQLNWYLHQKGLPVADLVRVTRTRIHEKDFGTLEVEERKEVMDAETVSMSIDESRIKGKQLLFIDDVRITGSHEEAVRKMISTYSHYNHHFLYYGAAHNNADPKVEDLINRKYVKGLVQIIDILSKPHILNARMVKDILRLSTEDVGHLIRNIGVGLAFNVVNLAIAEGYNKFPTFVSAFNTLQNIVKNELRSQKTEGVRP